ncbi:hypothetical protein P168DRAFT_234023 [Aspergillus campestris IBT 28561]|uniref:RHS repeat protein n=1 Tax=Aspergillus campestris (strain IBT 28561) TaxID=1392248 RepID=A0A2I1D6H4_ASPC2|nr:uncharacterized protein P168DRAFT_234023 [Aspergillus campestris IBT 28561]PKY05470.1 hypothetical protein P168DRAFT_234023 [Aspergillus campestris IBT 28561]
MLFDQPPFYTQAFNFGNLLEKGVDPRTGQFTCAIDIWDAPTDARNCPPFKLSLVFDPLNSLDLGLGKGWSFNLSYYDWRNGILHLSTGERFRVIDEGGDLLLPDQKLQTFKVKKHGSDYHVIHKSGQIEVLEDNSKCGRYVPGLIYTASGRCIELTWESHEGYPRLLVIRESSQMQVAIDYGINPRRILRAADNSEQCELSLYIEHDMLTRLVLPLPQAPSWTFRYHIGNPFIGLSYVTSPSGLQEEIGYDDRGHILPPSSQECYSLPYVTSHVMKPGNGQPEIKTAYCYSEQNFLGLGDVYWLQHDKDNLYQAHNDYEYWTMAEIEGGSRTTYTYNRFHLLVKSVEENGDCTTTQRTRYPFSDSVLFEDQLAYFQMPESITKTYNDGRTRSSRSETTRFEFDEWGNPTKDIGPDNVVVSRTYYATAGESAAESSELGCPADPHGFKRYLKTQTVIPPDTGFPAPIRTESYKYCQIQTAAGAVTSYYVAAEQHIGYENSDVVKRNRFKYVDEPISSDHGRLLQHVSRHLDQSVTTKDWSYELRRDDRLAVSTRVTSFDGHVVDDHVVYSTVHGLATTHRDHAGVEDHFEYNLLGQIVKTTSNPGTGYETVRRHEYTLLEGTAGTQTTVTDAKGVKTRTITDGLERLCRVERQSHEHVESQESENFYPLMTHDYNAQGQCVQTTQFDWLTTDDGQLQKQETTQQLEYDDWGQVSKVIGADGLITISSSDPINLTETKGIQGEGTTKTYFNVTGAPIRTVFHQANNQLYSEKIHYYDGLNRLVEEKDPLGRVTKYQPDSFDRIIQTTWPDARATTIAYAEHSEAPLPARVSLNGSTVGEQSFDGLGRVRLRKAGGQRTISHSYQSNAPEPMGTICSRGHESQLDYDPMLQFALKSHSRSDGIDTFDYDPQTGLPVQLRGADSTHTRHYTPSSLLKGETVHIHDEKTFSTEYQYSLAGKLQQYVNHHQQKQNIQYDDHGRTASLTQGNIKVSITYDMSSRPTVYSVEDKEKQVELTSILHYDDFGREIQRIVKKRQEILYILSQTYTQTSHISARTLTDGEHAVLREEHFIYDNRNRLKQYRCEGSQAPFDQQEKQLKEQVFEFDDYDNIRETATLFSDHDTNITTYTYAQHDPTQLIRISNTNNHYPANIDLEYDANGCLTKDEQGRSLEYDSLSRLVLIRDVNGAQLCKYQYDASGKLACQRVTDGPNIFLFYRGDSLIATKIDDDCISYVSDGTTYWGQIKQDGSGSPQNELWVSDSHNSILTLLDSQSEQLHHQSYTPYGFGGESEVAFNGHWRDPVTGWYHLGDGYRVYNPVLKRFHVPDSWSPFVSGEINPYTYCLGDPINRIDPSGHFSIWGVNYSWKNAITLGLGVVTSVGLGIATCGASLVVQCAAGAAVGAAVGMLGGALGDLADNNEITLNSVMKDGLWGGAAGSLGPVAGRVFGGVWRYGKECMGRAGSYTINNVAAYGLTNIAKEKVQGAIIGAVASQGLSFSAKAVKENCF